MTLSSVTVGQLADGIHARDQRAIARTISLLEAGHALGEAVLERLLSSSGRAWTVGVTGPPGAGKSTLVDALVAELRRRGRSVAVLAVDPSSTAHRGALLGDRVRMARAATDPEVYIRSVASRGALGGIAAVVPSAVTVLDAAGYELVFVETVGVGQSEVAVASAVDRTVLVTIPGAGDIVQAFKSGVIEVADLFVVNKSDLEGARRTLQDLKTALAVWGDRDSPVHAVSARSGEGLGEFAEALELDRRCLQGSEAAAARRRSRLAADADRLLQEAARSRALERFGHEPYDELRAALLAGAITPMALVRTVLGE